jgi:adenylate cyclase class 2
MNAEIEAKFLKINHDQIQERLKEQGAELEHPMRLMRRVVFGDAHMREKHGWIRVRDEGEKVMIAYKQTDALTIDGVKEIETTVGDFDAAVAIFRQFDMEKESYQESKRETWRLDGVEIALDEWPWLEPFIEVEGRSEAAVKDVAARLGLDWNNAYHGSVMTAYSVQYPWLNTDDKIGDLPRVCFGDPLPELFVKK